MGDVTGATMKKAVGIISAAGLLAAGIWVGATLGDDGPVSVTVEPVAGVPELEVASETAVVPSLPATVDWMEQEPDPAYSRTAVVEPDEEIAVENEPTVVSGGPSASSEPAADPEPATSHGEGSDVADAPVPEPEPEPEAKHNEDGDWSEVDLEPNEPTP